MKKFLMAVAIVGLVCVVAALAGETKYASGTTSAAVTFGPGSGVTSVKTAYCTTDKSGATLKFYARTGKQFNVNSAYPAAAATNFYVTNGDYDLTNSDTIAYVHKDGTAEFRTISTASTSNCTLTAGLTYAGTNGDWVVEMSLQGAPGFSTAGAAAGSTNVYASFEGDSVFDTPGHSPLYGVLDGTSNAVLTVTVGGN